MDVQSKLEHICTSHILKISWQELTQAGKKCCVYASPRAESKLCSPSCLLCKTPSCGQSLEDESFMWTSPDLVDKHPLPFLSFYPVSCTCSVLVALGPRCRWQWHSDPLGEAKSWCLLFSKPGHCTGADQWDQPAFQLPKAPAAAGTLTDLSVLSHC